MPSFHPIADSRGTGTAGRWVRHSNQRSKERSEIDCSRSGPRLAADILSQGRRKPGPFRHLVIGEQLAIQPSGKPALRRPAKYQARNSGENQTWAAALYLVIVN